MYKALLAVVCCISLQSNSAMGYGSTAQQEGMEQSGAVNEAYLTQRKEELEHSGVVNDAYLTGKEEELGESGLLDYASQTEAAERASNE